MVYPVTQQLNLLLSKGTFGVICRFYMLGPRLILKPRGDNLPARYGRIGV